MLMFDPPHPGEILRENYLKPLNLNITETSKKLGVSRHALSMLVNEKSSLSMEMAFKLAKAFDTTVETWIYKQLEYDIALAKTKINTDNVDVIYKAG